ncbi:NDR1/HIN1-like protein 10 [Lycium ferocissimum]|uniref:NDR1/HIN1-like protein 10 n=1 Tax=Lycium ferocissimum TaxID=112874 RepID=UPI002815EE1B|nr:NDR1/HIN1-like protein 10 [Lycium ferocissimum]
MGDPNRPVTGYPAAAAAPPNPNGYSTAQPPPPATAYPYAAPPYYNNNYPYQDPYTAQRNTFLRRVIAILVASTIITGTVLFVIWLIILPRVPEFQIDSLNISNLNLSNSLITANWDLHFTAKNPNKKITLYFDEIAAAIFYESLSIADTTVPPFFMDKRNETTQKVSFVASGAYVEKWAFDGMNKERAERGGVGFNVRMVARVSYKAGAWRARRRYLRVYCGDLFVGVALNKSSGNLLGGPRKGRVGL